MRSGSVVLGVGLLVLWLVGLNRVDAVGWLTWLDGIAGILAFMISGSVSGSIVDEEARIEGVWGLRRGPFFLSIMLFGMWVIGLATSVPIWQTWWNFAIACGFMWVASIGGRGTDAARRGETIPLERRQEERFRRGA